MPTRAVDALLVLVVCGLAFLLASTPARNSDLWLHLASGRWQTSAGLPDGKDPFSSATQGVFWVNHTWLSDLLLYWIYRLGDGSGLVVAKAALLAFLTALLCCFHRRGEGMGVLAFAGFAALMALGPWLTLQPALVSLFGVVLTLYLLERPSLLQGPSALRARAERWLLVPVFVLWANLDGWFVLGPVLICLYALGELMQRLIPTSPSGLAPAGSGGADDSYGTFLLAIAGIVACFATPYHYRVFSWPISLGLTHTEQALRHDPLGQGWLLSPFAARFADSSLFRSPAAWAYYLLFATSAVSFALSLRNLHIGRLFVWLLLGALSIYQARTIPFFVVAAAPFLALNVQEWAHNRPSFLRSLALPSRRLGVLLGIVLMVLAWPGWLQPAPYQPRAWTIEKDGSLVRLAERVKRWHDIDLLPADRFALTFSPEVAHYLAWFCPEEKGFVDSRWPLFDRVADDYIHMRQILLQEHDGDSNQMLAELLDAYRIDRILLHDSDWQRMARAYRRLFLAAPKWELIAVEGNATAFCRRGETTPSPKAFDYRRAPYRVALDQPASLPPRSPQPPRWFDFLRYRPDRGSADREEAALHLLTFDLQAQQLANRWLLAQATGLIGCRSGLDLVARLHFNPPLPPSPPEPLFLAVRAARRALAQNPDDATSFLRLGQAYLRLARQTKEPNWQTRLPDLAVLRNAQILTALEQAVLLRPNLTSAHALLAQLYFAEGQMDRCLDHLRQQLRIAEKIDKNADLAVALSGEVEKMEKLVSQSEKTYQANVTGKMEPSKVLMRAETAARNGLSRKALEMLQESSPAIFGRSGMDYELDLMMKAGQSYEVREVLKPVPELKNDINTYHNYHWMKVRAAASCGDYAEADAELDRDSEPYRRFGWSSHLLVPVRSAVAFQAARAVLTRPLAAESVFEALRPLGLLTELLGQEADRQVLRGLLALEAGEVETAVQHFRSALDVWGSETVAEMGSGLDFPARPIAQEMLRRMKE